VQTIHSSPDTSLMSKIHEGHGVLPSTSTPLDPITQFSIRRKDLFPKTSYVQVSQVSGSNKTLSHLVRICQLT